MKRILSLDGGGARGPVQLAALAMLEKHTGKRTFEMFDLIIGTSVGSIIGAMLSTGRYDAKDLLQVMKVELPKVFKRKFSRKAKYSKDPLRQAFYNLFGPDVCMGDAKTNLVVTSLEDTTKIMHFFKSWEEADSLIGLFDAVDRSSAAPLYFGPVVDDDKMQVWLDGGVGSFNNPSLYAYEEVNRLGWKESDTMCISLGCGNKSITRTFKDASNDGKIAQILNFMAPSDGGIARETASSEVCRFLEVRPWTFTRINKEIPKKLDAMDKVKYFDRYVGIGCELGPKLIKAYDGGIDG